MSFLTGIIAFKGPILFYSLIFLIVYLNRKKFDVHGKFIFLYRTKIGVKLMNTVANKARKLIKFLGYAGVLIGFAGMISTFILILFLTYRLILDKSGAGGASLVIPGLPIAGTGLVFPLITGWIVLFIIIAVHEFSHGIVASAHKIKVKNSGIAFFGPILGAFVELDEKSLSKKRHWIQHSVFAAGALSNFLTVGVVLLVVFFILGPIGSLLSISTGVIIFSQPGLPAEKAGIANSTVITGMNDQSVSTIDDFREIMKDISPGERIILKSNGQSYALTTTTDSEGSSQGYLGVWIIGEETELRNDNAINAFLFKVVKWFTQFFGWLGFLSLNIGLINLLPIFITDGARMLKIFLERLIPNKNRSLSIWMFFNWVSVFSLLILVFLPLLRWLESILDGILI